MVLSQNYEVVEKGTANSQRNQHCQTENVRIEADWQRDKFYNQVSYAS